MREIAKRDHRNIENNKNFSYSILWVLDPLSSSHMKLWCITDRWIWLEESIESDDILKSLLQKYTTAIYGWSLDISRNIKTTLTGLTRVRRFHQDDPDIFGVPDQ